MTIAVGLDVGNSTTEAVLARLGRHRVDVLGCAAVPTRGCKGSPASLDVAAAIVRRLERRYAVRAALVAMAPLRPVTTAAATLPDRSHGSGRLAVVRAGAPTVGGEGLGVGRPYRVGSSLPPPGEPVVAVVPASVGYAEAAGRLSPLAAAGRLVAVVLEADEAVLVANRLGAAIPVVDEVPPAALDGAALVAVEVRADGGPLRALGDALRLTAALGLRDDERADATRAAARLRDVANAVVTVAGHADVEAPADDAGRRAWVELRDGDGVRRLPLAEGQPMLRERPPGTASAYDMGDGRREVADLFTVDLAALSEAVLARREATASGTVALSAMHAEERDIDPSGAVAERLDTEVRVSATEAAAALAGGRTTPGADEHAAVVDIGGGTIDVVSDAGAIVAAGAGELVSVSTAALLGTTRAAAEWVKRGPCHRVDAPQVLLDEDGRRRFTDRPAPRDAVGALAVDGPAGLLPFDRQHAPSEWRALRLALKADILGGNVARCLAALDATPRSVVLVGGVAGDEEAVAAVARRLGERVAVGRGDAGGTLGHRHVVAYGLLLAAGRDGS